MDRKEYEQQYREENRDRINENHRQWAMNNPEKAKEIHRRYREKNRDKIRKKYQTTRKNKTQSNVEEFLKDKLHRLRTRSQKNIERGKYEEECNLTVEFLLQLWEEQDGRCALTNKKMTHQFDSLYSVSIDRIDSTTGYTTDNVQLVCQSVNYAKSNFTNEQFIHFWLEEEE